LPWAGRGLPRRGAVAGCGCPGPSPTSSSTTASGHASRVRVQVGLLAGGPLMSAQSRIC
jgi:hypothetical protein